MQNEPFNKEAAIELATKARIVIKPHRSINKVGQPTVLVTGLVDVSNYKVTRLGEEKTLLEILKEKYHPANKDKDAFKGAFVGFFHLNDTAYAIPIIKVDDDIYPFQEQEYEPLPVEKDTYEGDIPYGFNLLKGVHTDEKRAFWELICDCAPTTGDSEQVAMDVNADILQDARTKKAGSTDEENVVKFDKLLQQAAFDPELVKELMELENKANLALLLGSNRHMKDKLAGLAVGVEFIQINGEAPKLSQRWTDNTNNLYRMLVEMGFIVPTP